ncbi:NAD(P)-dependent malic enzyme [Fructobacillus americanaquae]|uniref:NADP-dependent malic enzyme n=1 Tax=Fructobacillus americanaquae TaxID=2940302 RepID=A0ABY5C3C1_9LACO|nr:NADP-dependent malic enzyme [Fructobacillus americanaquae]USS92323.1 NADP-dependent malic enzyme [Fructobacillus americanaquae]
MVDMNEVFALHEHHQGALTIQGTFSIKNATDLAKAYTPGVAALAKQIERHPADQKKYTISGKLVPVITDGSAVLGLGNIGPGAGLPIVEGKALIYKEFAGVDAIPLALNQVSTEEFVATIKAMAPSFAGIHLEDIAAPRVFEIEQQLQKALDIPVYHDDQTGTAIVVLAALINAAKVVGKPLTELKIVINGVGAAGVATAKLLLAAGIKKQTLVDIHGVIRADNSVYNRFQRDLAKQVEQVQGESLDDVIDQQDVFIGLSDEHLLSTNQVRRMADKAIILALANPVPEILPEEAKTGGAAVVATGSSQWANQVNNILALPGLFKGLLATDLKSVSIALQLHVATALANLVEQPRAGKIVPAVFDAGVVAAVEKAVLAFAKQEH